VNAINSAYFATDLVFIAHICFVAS